MITLNLSIQHFYEIPFLLGDPETSEGGCDKETHIKDLLPQFRTLPEIQIKSLGIMNMAFRKCAYYCRTGGFS